MYQSRRVVPRQPPPPFRCGCVQYPFLDKFYSITYSVSCCTLLTCRQNSTTRLVNLLKLGNEKYKSCDEGVFYLGSTLCTTVFYSFHSHLFWYMRYYVPPRFLWKAMQCDTRAYFPTHKRSTCAPHAPLVYLELGLGRGPLWHSLNLPPGTSPSIAWIDMDCVTRMCFQFL